MFLATSADGLRAAPMLRRATLVLVAGALPMALALAITDGSLVPVLRAYAMACLCLTLLSFVLLPTNPVGNSVFPVGLIMIYLGIAPSGVAVWSALGVAVGGVGLVALTLAHGKQRPRSYYPLMLLWPMLLAADAQTAIHASVESVAALLVWLVALTGAMQRMHHEFNHAGGAS